MMRTKVRLISNVILALIIIQAVRAAIVQLLLILDEQAILFGNFSFIIIGFILFLIFRPDLKSLGLDLSSVTTKGRNIYVGVTLFVLLLMITSPSNFTGQYENIISMIETAVIFPVFEELLFRGYLWNEMEKSEFSDWKVWIIITVLFGIWHLGYYNTIYIKMSQNTSDFDMTHVMFYKALIGMAYGFATGYLRKRLKNAYGCILLHSFFNIFAR